MTYFERQLGKLLIQTVETRPLVYLNGPRQVGKSTLAEHITVGKETNYITFDSPLALAAATSDPTGFIRALPKSSSISWTKFKWPLKFLFSIDFHSTNGP